MVSGSGVWHHHMLGCLSSIIAHQGAAEGGRSLRGDITKELLKTKTFSFSKSIVAKDIVRGNHKRMCNMT